MTRRLVSASQPTGGLPSALKPFEGRMLIPGLMLPRTGCVRLGWPLPLEMPARGIAAALIGAAPYGVSGQMPVNPGRIRTTYRK
jgi:hypothetical protein